MRCQNESSDLYFEEIDGSKGLYLKEIMSSKVGESSQSIAEEIQDIYLNTFTKIIGGDWTVADRRSTTYAGIVREALDFYNAEAQHRVLSLVVCSNLLAIQLLIHDYACEDYSANRNDFLTLEASVLRRSEAV